MLDVKIDRKEFCKLSVKNVKWVSKQSNSLKTQFIFNFKAAKIAHFSEFFIIMDIIVKFYLNP